MTDHMACLPGRGDRLAGPPLATIMEAVLPTLIADIAAGDRYFMETVRTVMADRIASDPAPWVT